MKNNWQEFMSLPSAQLSSGFLVAAGVVMGCAASFITCLGLNLQKLSLCEPANENVAPCQQPKWLAGLACVVVGSVIDFVSFGLAPQSLIAPLAALSLLFNIGMASYLLGEKYCRTDLYATAIIFFGTAVTITNASHKEIDYSFQDLRELWLKDRMLTYVFLVLLAVAFHYFLIWIVRSQNLIGRKWKLAEMLGYCGFAGITGGQSLLFAKSIMEMIKYTFHGGDPFFHFEAYLAVAILALCLYSQINFLNAALKGFDSLYVIPCYERSVYASAAFYINSAVSIYVALQSIFY